jgi:predicted ATP-dependent endonuclease of OLD family
MNLLKFRAKNFRSVFDSGEVNLSSDVTVLAGKNEAGKTVLFKALEKFNQESKFDGDDLPIDSPEATPEITLTFKLSRNDFSTLTEGVRLPSGLSKDAVTSIPFEVTKTFNNEYQFDGKEGSVVDLLLRSKERKKRQIIEKLNPGFLSVRALFETHGVSAYPLATTETLDSDQVDKLRIEFLPQIEAALGRLPTEQQEEVRKFSEQVGSTVAEFDQLVQEYKINTKKMWEVIPIFVYFEAFDKEDTLPFEIAIEEAKKHVSVQRYCAISGLDLERLSDPQASVQTKLALVKNVSAVIEGDFKDCWKQDKIDLRVEMYGDTKLIFAFYEQGKKHPFKMDQRSKGLQWFLAFYLLLKAEVKQYTSIILIDEPGLFVHAQAQNDILAVLTVLAKENQILLTTHSPYLIDPARLDRIRLVIRDFDRKKNKGTRVYSLTSEAAVDRVTLMPIITAIGLDITKQLTIAADHNLVVEGISDYYYLRAALKFIPATVGKNFEGVHLIPLTGADNVPPLVSLLIGWRLGFHVLLDRDIKGKEIAQTLSEKLLVPEEQISFVSRTDNHRIEDLISKIDFNKYVLERADDYKENELNSDSIPGSNKAPFAKRFFEQVEGGQITVSRETKDSFTALFTALSSKKMQSGN